MKKANLYKGLAAVVMFFECIVLGFSVSLSSMPKL